MRIYISLMFFANPLNTTYSFTSVINGCSNNSLNASSAFPLLPCLCKLRALLYNMKASDSCIKYKQIKTKLRALLYNIKDSDSCTKHKQIKTKLRDVI